MNSVVSDPRPSFTVGQSGSKTVGDDARRGTVVTVCTYNERENLADLIEQVRRFLPDADILVIDDLSPDGTGELADELAGDDCQIRVIHRQGPRGLGSATLHGFQTAVAAGYEFLINMDADLSHPPCNLPELRELVTSDRADVAIGSRYVNGGKISGWPLRRHVMSWCINVWTRWWMGLTPRDCSGSYRCYRVSLLEQIDLTDFRSSGYSVQEELLFRCEQAGARFAETPIHFEDRIVGNSKINLTESLKAVWVIARCGLERFWPGNSHSKSTT